MRCSWVPDEPLYVTYHDLEWGKTKASTQALFEALTLEIMQAGLSFFTILKKRAAFHSTFFQYDLNRLSQATDEDLNLWLQDASIVRHEKKLIAIINNAKCIKQIEKTTIFSDYLKTKLTAIRPGFHPTDNPLSMDDAKKLSISLKKDGFLFIGPMTLYSFLEATGFIDNHEASCFLSKGRKHV